MASISRFKQNKKSGHPYVDIGQWETCTQFQQKLFKFIVVRVGQSFRQSTWFFENSSALSKFLYGILHYLISIIKL